MMDIASFLKEKTEGISFIELKQRKQFEKEGFPDNLPLPILTEDMVEGVLQSKMEEHIDFRLILKGMIYVIGADETFLYGKEYQRIVKREPEIEKFILWLIHKAEEINQVDDVLVYSHGYARLFPESKRALLNYALSLEKKAEYHFHKQEKKEGTLFLVHSDKILNQLLDLDEQDAPALYKLGYHAKSQGLFLRAKLFWEKLLNSQAEEELKQEIVEELDKIENQVVYEEAYHLVMRGKAEEALELLNPLYEQYKDWWSLSFLVGLAYRQTEDYTKAVEAFERALLYEAENSMILNELAISKASLGYEEEAFALFEKAISLSPSDGALFSNRAMLHMMRKNEKAAREDVEMALSLDDQDEIALAIKKQLNELH